MHTSTIFVRYTHGAPVPVGVSLDDQLDMVRVRLFDRDVILTDKENVPYDDYTKTIAELGIEDRTTIHTSHDHARVDVPVQVNTGDERNRGY